MVKKMSKSNNKITIIKCILLVIFIALMAFFTMKLLPLFKNLSTTSGRLDFKNKINSMGALGPVTIVGMVILQIFLAFLPGEPIEILSGMCYGTIGGMILVFIGVFISSFIIIYLVKLFGKNFIYIFFGDKSYEKLINSKLFRNKKKLEILLFILFFIPGTPKDLLTYVGGILPIKPINFLIISTLARFPSIITSTFTGENITSGNFNISIISFVITFIISTIGLVIFNIMSKRAEND